MKFILEYVLPTRTCLPIFFQERPKTGWTLSVPPRDLLSGAPTRRSCMFLSVSLSSIHPTVRSNFAFVPRPPPRYLLSALRGGAPSAEAQASRTRTTAASARSRRRTETGVPRSSTWGARKPTCSMRERNTASRRDDAGGLRRSDVDGSVEGFRIESTSLGAPARGG